MMGLKHFKINFYGLRYSSNLFAKDIYYKIKEII